MMFMVSRSSPRITLIADKKEYEVGDTAEILIPSPYSETVQALVTIERGHLVQAEVQPIQLDFGMRQIASIPVRSG
jgi:uncharacterized protein YfaS (alpha-2-macroglobulin family)